MLIILLIVTIGSIGVYNFRVDHQKVIASFSPYNFTEEPISDIYVNGTWAGNVMEHSGGGAGVCCATIPRKWQKKLSVEVRWLKSDGKTWIKKNAMIPEYTAPASLQLLFYKNDDVGVYVMDYWPCSDKHPMPKDVCNAKENK